MQLWAWTVVEEEEPRGSSGPLHVPNLSHLPADQHEELEIIMPVELFSTKPQTSYNMTNGSAVPINNPFGKPWPEFQLS